MTRSGLAPGFLFRLFLFILVVTGISSCHVTKRRYRRGFYIETRGELKKSDRQADTLANSGAGTKDTLIAPPDDTAACSTIIWSDGTRSYAGTVEISGTKIRYTRCGKREKRLRSRDLGKVNEVRMPDTQATFIRRRRKA